MADKQVLLEVKVNMTDTLKELAQYQMRISEIDAATAELNKRIKAEGDQSGELRTELARLKEERKAYSKMVSDSSRTIQNQIVAEQTYTGTLKGLCAQLALAKDGLRAMSQEDPKYKERAAEVDALNQRVKDLEAEYGVHTREVGHYALAAKALKDEIRELGDALVVLKLEGKETSAEYVEMSNRLADLKDAQADVQKQTNGLASDTKGLDVALQGTMIAVSACQAAMKVFDDGTEAGKKAVEIMKKMQIVVVALGAAISIQNSLQKQSLIIQTAIGLQAKANIAYTKLQAAASTRATGATLAQAAAMKMLNVVMSMNPIGAVLTAVVALVAGFVALTTVLNRQTSAQKAATVAAKEYEEYARKAAAAAELLDAQQSAQMVNATLGYQKELISLYKNGATKEQIAKKQMEMNNALTQQEIDGIRQRLKAAKEIRDKAKEDYALQAAAYNELIQTKGKDAKATKKQAEELEKARQAMIQTANAATSLAGELNDKITQQSQNMYDQRADAAEKAYNRQQRSIELWAQRQQDAIDMAKTYLWDYTKSEEENTQLRWRLEQETAAKTFALKVKVEQKKLDLERKYGKITAAEYKQRSATLAAETAAFMTQQLAATEEHNRQILNAAISLAGGKTLDAQLAEVERKYAAAAEAIKNDANLAADERAYYLAMLEQKQAEERIAIRQQTERRITETIAKDIDERYRYDLRQFSASEEERLRLAIAKQQELISKKKEAGQNTLADEATLQAMQYDLRVASVNRELQLAWQNADKQYRIKREFLERELEFAELTAEQRAALEEELANVTSEHNQQMIADIENYANQIMDIAGSLNEVLGNLESAQIARAESKSDKEKERLDKDLKAGLISRTKYEKEVAKLDEELDKKKAEIARKQAIREKVMSAMQIGINTAVAIMKIWAEVPKFDFGVSTGVLTALAAAAGAAQLAAVLSTPIPTARIGGRVSGATHEQGGVLINTEDEERIISANPAKAFPELLNLISYIGKHSAIPNTGYASRSLLGNRATGGNTAVAEADFDLLAQKVGQQVGEQIKGLQIYASVVDIRRAEEEYTKIEQSAKM